MLQELNNKRVAIMVAASIYNRKGLFLAVHERIKHLKAIADYQIDAFIVSSYKSPLVTLLTREKNFHRPTTIDIDGINYQIIWLHNTILGYILLHKLNKPDLFKIREFRKYIHLFENYNLIEGHACGEYVAEINKKIHTPFMVTWHGSDIHTLAFLSEEYKRLTAQVIEKASVNFFVSKALLEQSEQITNKGIKVVSYNGRDERFIKYDEDTRLELRKLHNVVNKRVVAFVGNLIPVKNISALPRIFSIINKECPEVVFWMIGDGVLRKTFEQDAQGLPIRMWGNVDYKDMPALMNIIDILVLPSKNEGLPLVTVEALSCGCHVVGSRVGGVAEAIGVENTVPLDCKNFEAEFAKICISHIKSSSKQELSAVFNWNLTASNENEYVMRLLANS